MSRRREQVSVPLPAALREFVERAAEREDRSVASMIHGAGGMSGGQSRIPKRERRDGAARFAQQHAERERKRAKQQQRAEQQQKPELGDDARVHATRAS